jgi:hypothetical protein
MRLIALNYVKGWLVLDVIAVFPFGLATGNWDIEYLCRLVRISKLPNAVNMINGKGISQVIILIRTAGGN